MQVKQAATIAFYQTSVWEYKINKQEPNTG